MTTTRAQTDEQADEELIDLLIPHPRGWLVRLIIGALVTCAVGVGAYLWGYGYVYPRPESRGSSSGGTTMGLTSDGTAVFVTAILYNSSPQDLLISAATASLPGATVRNVNVATESGFFPPFQDLAEIPAVVRAESLQQIVVSFVPVGCIDDSNEQGWGSIVIELEIFNSWLPTFSRSYELPDPVWTAGSGNVSVFWPDEQTAGRATTPLAAACELLKRQ